MATSDHDEAVARAEALERELRGKHAVALVAPKRPAQEDTTLGEVLVAWRDRYVATLPSHESRRTHALAAGRRARRCRAGARIQARRALARAEASPWAAHRARSDLSAGGSRADSG